MLCSSCTDPIEVEVECGECLCERKSMSDWDEKVGMLHCYVGEQLQDVLFLLDRSDFGQG
jgi:hypothetical protein